MIDEHIILAAERLRDELTDFKSTLRKRYHSNSQVTSDELRRQAATLAQKWLVDLGTGDEINLALGDPVFADLNVKFQRLLTFSEHATKRTRYDGELRSILNNYSTLVILPLKQMRGRDTVIEQRTPKFAFGNSIFVGQSFDQARLSCQHLYLRCVRRTGTDSRYRRKAKSQPHFGKGKRLDRATINFRGNFYATG